MYDDQNFIPSILPRSAWESPIAHLRAIFKAKKALDEIERVHANTVSEYQSIPAIPGIATERLVPGDANS